MRQRRMDVSKMSERVVPDALADPVRRTDDRLTRPVGLLPGAAIQRVSRWHAAALGERLRGIDAVAETLDGIVQRCARHRETAPRRWRT